MRLKFIKMVCNWFKLLVKWIFLVAGVPALAGTLLYIAGIYAFEISESIWQNLLGLFFILLEIVYEILVIKSLIDETKECF